mgnify:FL=1
MKDGRKFWYWVGLGLCALFAWLDGYEVLGAAVVCYGSVYCVAMIWETW